MLGVGEVLARVDRLVVRFASFSQQVLLWPALYAVAWGAAAWPLAHRDRIVDWSKNDLGAAEVEQQVLALIVAAGVVALVWLLFALIGRLTRGRWAFYESADRFNRLFAFSLAAPFLVALSQPSVEWTRPGHTLFFIACATVCTAPTVAFLWESLRSVRSPFRSTARPSRLVWVGSAVLLLGLFVAYSAWFSRLAINNHHALHTRIFDLAIYDNIFYQSAHGNPLGCTLSSTRTHVHAHFDAILVLLSPLYLINPRAELILVLQSVWCGLGIVPAYLLGRHHVGSVAAGVVLALGWALYPALHGANLYEFHSLTLLAMPMLWLLYFITAGRLRAFFILLPFVLLVREDASLLVCFVAIAAILTRDPRLVRAGWVTFLIAAVYFVVIKTFIMGAADPLGGKGGFGWYYADLIPEKGGLTALLKSVLVNPTFVLDFVLREQKVVFVAQLMLPLAFLPLFADRWRFAAAFGAFYILLASRRSVYSIHFQYSVVLFPVLFALTPIAIRRLRDGTLPARVGLQRPQLVAVLLAFIVVSSALTAWKFGAVVPNMSFRGGWSKIPFVLSDNQANTYQKFRDFIAQVPPDAPVTVMGRFGPHLSNRAEAYRYRTGERVGYLAFDVRDMKGDVRKDHRERVKAGDVELIQKQGTFELYRIIR